MRLRPARAALPALLVVAGLATLPGAGSASGAVTAADREAQVARANGVSRAELRDLLADPAVRVGVRDRLYVVDPAHRGTAAERQEARAQASAGSAAAPRPLAETFTLHSKPGSQRVIFIDVDGAEVRDTAWNSGEDAIPGGTYGGWDPAGNGPTFTDAEKEAVQEVWARVAEDYAPFDVDVTTQDPGAAAITRSSLSDQVFGTRALVTSDDAAWNGICQRRCGGIAYMDVVDLAGQHATYQPAWVFADGVSDVPGWVAEALSHEVGHNFGLDHDGGPQDPDYHAGHGFWAPIMGASYDAALSQWSRGSYPGATQAEDDVAVIAGNGAPYRADEAGGVPGTAADLPTGTAWISRRDDVDVYRLGACAGTLTVQAQVAALGANLDLRLRVLTADGTALAVADPVSSPTRAVATGLGATLTLPVLTGQPLFVEVDGVGQGTWTTQGYDDYGSLGAYTLTATGCTPPEPDPDPEPEPDPEPQPDPEPPVVTAPSAVVLGAATSGRRGGPVTVRLAWRAPASTGGVALRGYEVYAYRFSGTRVVRTLRTRLLPPTVRAATLRLPKGRYRLAVRASNAVGAGPLSKPSRVVVAR